MTAKGMTTSEILSKDERTATVKLFAYDKKGICRGNVVVKMPLRSLDLATYIATWKSLGKTDDDLKSMISTQFKVEKRAAIGRSKTRNGSNATV